MSTPPPLRSPDGVAPNLRHAFGGIWRLTLRRSFSPRQFAITLGCTVVFGLVSAASVRFGQSQHYFLWATQVYLTVIVPVLAFLSGGSLIRDDMSPVSVDYVLTRPVPRPILVAYRVISHLACLQLWFLLPLAALTAVGIFRNIPAAIDALPTLLLAQVLASSAFAVLGVFAGALTTRYLVLGIVYGGVVEVGLGSIPMQLNRLSILHHIRTIVDPLVTSPVSGGTAAAGTLGSIGVLAALAIVALAAAALIFSLREFAGARPKES